MRLWETLPKTRGLTPIPIDSAPFGPNAAEAENKAFPKHRCNPLPQMTLPNWQNVNLIKTLNLSSASVRTKALEATVSESGRQL